MLARSQRPASSGHGVRSTGSAVAADASHIWPIGALGGGSVRRVIGHGRHRRCDAALRPKEGC
eukprot:15263344-Alexandrium_andersonii.AAC.1